ncbi:SusC/RagA family TonB-linked outer membrane protein [Desertivirga brevis]|uniref:SusC/RagA family TonB-linked outer membrane protein n=1 Tax=Desertivirga brevis TaxID=2810310 RepID=UPI001A97466C|nr:TonB-dependent receptor [Pedobacter sp. SYSU D00873]
MIRSCTVRKYLNLLFVLWLWLYPSTLTYAQNKVTGSVVDAATNNVLPGASVKIKGSTSGISTDMHGRFSISAREGDVLIVTMVGFAPVEIEIGTFVPLKVELKQDVTVLRDVIVGVGYGTMKKTDLSSSQVSIGANEVRRTVNTTIEQAIQGRAANVYVTSNSGQPGAAPSVIFRGFNSISGNNQPLYVVDGVQFKPDDGDGTSNLLAGINPDDVETINLLQGPSATSVYGASGAAGVVVITTKRGKAGATNVAFNSLYTIQDEPKLIRVMNLKQWAEYQNEYAKANYGPADPYLADPSILGEGTNWQDALFRKTLLRKSTFSLSGGNEQTTFYFSGEYFNQEGVAKGSGFNRYSVKLNLDNQAKLWLKVGASLGLNRTREKLNISESEILKIAISQNPSIPLKNADGSWGGPDVQQYQQTNPVALAEINDNTNVRKAALASAYADINFSKKFVFHNELNGRYDQLGNYRFNPSYRFGGYENPITRSSRSNTNNFWYSFHSRLEYKNAFKKHSITGMLAHEFQENGYDGVSGSRSKFVNNEVQELNGGDASTAVANSSRGSGARESYFGRINYVYNDKYIAQFTYRADGSSAFGADNRWGYFPAGSIAWRISRENFMKDIPHLDELKLRAEYGVSGNSNIWGPGYYGSLSAVPTPWGTGFLASNFPNPELRWEASKTWNAGFDLHMFRNRLEIIADFYLKDIDHLLTKNQYPYYSGGDVDYSPGYIDFPWTNIGSMRNRGFGITVNSVNLVRKNITWKTSANVSVDRNKVTSLYSDKGIWANLGSLRAITQVGMPAGLFNGYLAEGLFQNLNEVQMHALQTENSVKAHRDGTWVGDIIFKDLNNDGVIDEKDRTIIGNPWPKFTLGFNNSIGYKNFDLNLFFTGSFGNDLYNYNRNLNEIPASQGTSNNYYASSYNFARPSSYNLNDSDVHLLNSGNRIPRLAGGNGNSRANTWYVEDGSYVRLKNIALSYKFSKSMLEKTRVISGLTATFNIQNAFTITKYTGYDPEVGLSPYNGTFLIGADQGRYPSTRMYTFNLTANF